MPDDLRWNSFIQNHLPTCSMKPVPGAKKIGDHCEELTNFSEYFDLEGEIEESRVIWKS